MRSRRQTAVLVTEAQVEAVYHYIWECLKANDELPSRREMAQVLSLSMSAVHECVVLLRQADRLSPTTLLPSGYRQWWRQTVRVEQRWTLPPLVPLRRKLPQQIPLWENAHV